MSKTMTFSPPIQGRLWDADGTTSNPVTILGVDLDAGSAVVVDSDARLHIVQFGQVDFISVAPDDV